MNQKPKPNPFLFLKDKDENVYQQLTESWKNFKTDFVYANNKLRTGIEKIDYHLTYGDCKKRIELLIKRGVIPDDKDIDLVRRRRNNIEYDNAKVKQHDIKRYEKVIDLIYHALLKKYQMPKREEKLNTDYFPIGEYEVLEVKQKTILGNSIKEYQAQKMNSYGISQKAIIREYSKPEEETLYTHEESSLMVRQNNLNEKAKHLMNVFLIPTKEQTLVSYVGYEITEEAQKLSEIELNNIKPKQKMKLILDVLAGLEELLTIPEPKINHRNINPNNIYVITTPKEITAKLANFEYCKINTSSENYQTAYEYIKKQYEENQEFAYYYPQAGIEHIKTCEDWEKLDIYSVRKSDGIFNLWTSRKNKTYHRRNKEKQISYFMGRIIPTNDQPNGG